MHCLVAFWTRQSAAETVIESCDEHLAQFTTERQPVLRLAVTFSKTSCKHMSMQIKGIFAKLTLHLYFEVSRTMLLCYFVPFIVNNLYPLF
jgi:hypothetical protein